MEEVTYKTKWRLVKIAVRMINNICNNYCGESTMNLFDEISKRKDKKLQLILGSKLHQTLFLIRLLFNYSELDMWYAYFWESHSTRSNSSIEQDF